MNGVNPTEAQRTFRASMIYRGPITGPIKLVNVDPTAKVRIRHGGISRMTMAYVKTAEGISEHIVVRNPAGEWEAMHQPERFNHWNPEKGVCWMPAVAVLAALLWIAIIRACHA